MALENLKRELENLVKDIETRANNYVVCVQSLMQADLDVNVAQKYKSQYWEQNNVLMAQLRERIKNYDMPYIDSCIVGAQTALANYKG